MRIGDYELIAQVDCNDIWVRYQARRAGEDGDLDLRVLNCGANRDVLWDRLFKRLKILRLINHTSLIRVVELADDHQPPYLVVEGNAGRTLADMLAARSPLPAEEALPLAAQLTAALATAHRFGVPHGAVDAERIVVRDSDVRLDLSEFVPTIQDDVAPAEAFAKDVRDCGRLLTRLILPNRSTDDDERDAGVVSISAAMRESIDRMADDDPRLRPSMSEIADRLEQEAACLFGGTISAPPVPDGDDFAATMVMRELPATPSRQRMVPVIGKGDRLGRFHLLEELGQGGMGSVYRARDEADGTIVAVKVIRPEAMQSSESLGRFRREAQVLTEVNNPHVTNLIEFNEDDVVPYLVMEFVAGQSLQQRLDREKKLDEPTAVAIMSDVCRALSAAHRRGIVHRDIKPDNILLADSDEKRVKLSDFGVARQLFDVESTRLTQAGSAVGTPLYMSPEQCEDGGSADPRSDVYSIGATLFHLLAGRPPFLANSFARLVRMHVEDAPPDLHAINDSLTESVCRIVDRALAKQPQSRYSGSDELLRTFEDLAAGESSSAESHPLLPSENSGRVLTYSWSWDLRSTPAELWPHVSNTDRFNRAVGLPAVQFTDSRDTDGRMRRFGSFSKLGVAVCWKEHPFEWIEGRQFGVLREYTRGPFRWVSSHVRLTPLKGGTRLNHTLRIQPSGLLGRLLCPFEIGFRMRRGFDRVYLRIDEWLQSLSPQEHGSATFESPAPLSRRQWQTLEAGLQALREIGLAKEPVESLGDFLAEASPQEVSRIRPRALARQLRANAESLTAACLHAARIGLLTLGWDILCPLCRVPAEMQSTLQAVREHLYCPACDLDVAVDPAESVELVFRIDESIRPGEAQTWCVGGPSHLPHVVAQIRLAPGERMRLDLSLTHGHYAVRVTGEDASDRLSVFSNAATDRAEWQRTRLGKSRFDLKPGEQQVVLHNDSANESVIRLERSANRDDAIVAAEAIALPLFRELFPNETLSAENSHNRPRLTVLAAGGFTRETVSDETTARLHSLKASIVANSGNLLAQNDNDLLAVFYHAADAVKAAIAFATSSDGRTAQQEDALCIALHCGDVCLENKGGTLAVDGESVDVARQILRTAEAGGICLSATVSTQSPVADFARDAGFEFIVFERTLASHPDLLLFRLAGLGE